MAAAALLVAACCLGVALAESPFEQHQVVPDVIDQAPQGEIQVVYSPTAKAQFGNELKPTQVKDQPAVSWPTEADALYTIAMTDPDAPSRENPIRREYLHFLVGNILGNDISKGDVLFEYIGAGPPQGTGLHRYVWLAYKQPGRIEFNQPTVSKIGSGGQRPKFSIRKFAAEKNLGQPVAGNFFQAQYDDYVPELHKQLG